MAFKHFLKTCFLLFNRDSRVAKPFKTTFRGGSRIDLREDVTLTLFEDLKMTFNNLMLKMWGNFYKWAGAWIYLNMSSILLSISQKLA